MPNLASFNTVIASAAKQSISRQKKLDCFAALAMTTKYDP
jgi:hypothetical protein